MYLSSILFSIAWIFSFLATSYLALSAFLDTQWLKHSFLSKIVADPLHTILSALFFGAVAAVAFTLSHYTGKAEENLLFSA